MLRCRRGATLPALLDSRWVALVRVASDERATATWGVSCEGLRSLG